MPSGHKVKTGVNPERRGAKVKSQADNMHQQREKQDSNMGKNPKTKQIHMKPDATRTQNSPLRRTK